MKKSILIIFVALLGGGSSVVFLPKNQKKDHEKQRLADLEYYELHPQKLADIQPYPLKTMAQWTSPVMYANDIPALARHDFVVVDLENMFNNRGSLLELKRLNPDIKLIPYSNSMEIFLTKYPTRPWQNKIIDEIVNNRQEWLLRTVVRDDKQGWYQNYATFWPGMTMLNMSASCPKINGETYSEWIAKKISREILNDSIWDDGKFDDNLTENVAWMYRDEREKIDIDGDGSPDKDEYVDAQWHKGVEKYLQIIRKETQPKRSFWSFFKNKKNNPQRDFIIIGNKGSTFYLNYVNGKFFELFPNNYLGDGWADGWLQSFENAQKTGPYTVFQVDRANIQFGLASALLLDNVYFAIGQDDAGVFPELYLDTGKPLGKFYRVNNVWLRKYEHIVVRVEPLKRLGEIMTHEEYQRNYASLDIPLQKEQVQSPDSTITDSTNISEIQVNLAQAPNDSL